MWDVDEYILAFEDLHSMHWGDQNGINDGYPEWSDIEPDFTDLVVIVESVTPIPAPGAVILAGIGTTLVGYRRRRGIELKTLKGLHTARLQPFFLLSIGDRENGKAGGRCVPGFGRKSPRPICGGIL